MPTGTKSKKALPRGKNSTVPTKPKKPRSDNTGGEKKADGSKRQLYAVVVFFSALLLASIIFIPGVHAWLAIHNFFLGIFGICACFIPVIMIYIAFTAAFEKRVQTIRAKLIEMSALIILIDAAIQIFACYDMFKSGGFGALYNGGIALKSGGVAGGATGGPLYAFFGKTGAAITVILLALVFVMLLADLTLPRLIRLFKPRHRRAAEDLPLEPEPVNFKHKKPRFNIDVRIGSPTEQGSEADKPPVPAAEDKPDSRKTKGGTAKESENKPQPQADLDALVSRVVPPESTAQNAATEGEPAENQQSAPAAVTAAASASAAASAAAFAASEVTIEAARQLKIYEYPPITLLKQEANISNVDVSEELKSNAARLVDTLRSFGVETRITDISRGPAVTRYELQPSAGVKISRITSLSDDIALNLASAGVRIEAPIPNKAAVGIEVPNKNINVVHIREIIDSEEFRAAQSRLSVALGRDIAGKVTVADIGKMPHVLIAGATGSGKSVCINSIIISLLYKSTPEEVKFLMVDPKVVELGIYNGIPHLLVPVVTNPGKAAGALNWAVQEMLKRYKLFADSNVRDLKGYNKLAERVTELEKLPQIVIIIDELSDLMMAAPKDVEEAVCRLAQMARAAGMHLVIATQRPSVDVITGVIKANIPSRIAFAVSSQVDSRTILDSGGAEKLLGRGDMLFLPMGASKATRVQGCFVSDAEVEEVVEFVKNGGAPDYDEDVMDEIEKQALKDGGGKPDEGSEGDADAMLPQAIECVIDAGLASTSLLQRRLKLGYARAARIVDQMEARGIVGPFEGSKPRQVLITRQQWLEMTVNGKDEE